MGRAALPGLAVVPAQPADLASVVELLEDAGRWLEGRGIQQWPAVVSEPLRAYLAERIAAGETFVALLDGEIVGTLRLQWADPAVWDERPPDAGYVHGLAVRRALAGRGIGGALLGWAERQIAAAGRQYLRLDCVAGNQALCTYYRRAGFRDCGQVSDGSWTAQRWERNVMEGL